MRRALVLKPAGIRCFLLLLLSACVSGCSYYATSYELTFSPDGSTVALVRAKKWDLPLPPEMPTFFVSVYLRWCDLNKGVRCRTVELDTSGPNSSPFDESAVRLRFSPDSKHLAATTPLRLLVVNCGSRKIMQLSRTGETVTAFGWLGNDEIGYVVQTTKEGKVSKRTDQAFFRQKTHSGPEARVEFYKETGLRYTPLESWSPDGRFVIFQNGYGKPVQLLNVAAGTVSSFGPSKSSYGKFSWRPDGSAALCAFSGYKQPIRVLVMYLPSGEILDVTKQFTEAFQTEQSNSLPSFQALWTADGEYIIVHDYPGLGGCLVRPRPWEVIPLTKRLLHRLGRTDHKWPHNNIVRFPTPGWVGVWVDGQTYAVDYEAKTPMPIGSTRNWLPGWILTPDGKRAVTVNGEGELVVLPITLPSHQ